MLVFYREKSSVKTFGSPIFLIKDSVLCVWDMWLLGRYEGDGVVWYFGTHSVWMNNEWCVWKDEIRNIDKGTVNPMVECSWQSNYVLIWKKVTNKLHQSNPKFWQKDIAMFVDNPALLAPSGALIAIPTYYGPTSTSTPTFSDHTGPQHWTFTFWATTAI